MAENKMEQVAKLFGKKLGERFVARFVGHEKFEIGCKITKEGLFQEIIEGMWSENPSFFVCLLTGKVEIVEG